MSAGEMRPLPSRQELPKALTGSAFLDYAVHLSRRHGFLYVVNPKVGCSSILWTLQRLEAQDADREPSRVGVIHDRQASPLLAPSDIGASAELLRGEEFFKFTFVRNPFDRLLSCFLNKISRPTVQRQLLLAQMGRPKDSEYEIELAEFVAAIGGQALEDMDPHWRPQWAQTLQGHARYDAIGRFERFDQELLRIGERISPQFEDYVHREVRQATGPKPYHLITPAVAEQVRELYGRDFTEFQYALEVPA